MSATNPLSYDFLNQEIAELRAAHAKLQVEYAFLQARGDEEIAADLRRIAIKQDCDRRYRKRKRALEKAHVAATAEMLRGEMVA